MTNGESVLCGQIAVQTPLRSLITIKEMGMDKLQNIHPGEILLEEFLIPMEISQTRLAHSINVPPRRINEIVLGKRGITADTALRLARVFGTSVQFWMGLQDEYELREARSAIEDQLKNMMPIAA
jgi:antitoxin HigA-1